MTRFDYVQLIPSGDLLVVEWAADDSDEVAQFAGPISYADTIADPADLLANMDTEDGPLTGEYRLVEANELAQMRHVAIERAGQAVLNDAADAGHTIPRGIAEALADQDTDRIDVLMRTYRGAMHGEPLTAAAERWIEASFSDR